MTWPPRTDAARPRTDAVRPPRFEVRSLLLACGAAAMVAAGYVHLVVTRCPDWARLERQCARSSARLASLRDQASQREDYEKIVAKDEEQFGELELTQSPKRYVPSLLEQLGNLAGETGCELAGFQPGALASGPGYSIVPVTVTVEGGFPALQSFLEKLARFPKVVAVRSVAVAAVKPKATEPAEHLVRMELHALAHLFPLPPGQQDEYTDEGEQAPAGQAASEPPSALHEETKAEPSHADQLKGKAPSGGDSGGVGDRAVPAVSEKPGGPSHKPKGHDGPDAAAPLDSPQG
jgi:Tfp pilus assembly protein PilO